MSDIRNCRRCGKMFKYDNKPICPACVKKEEEDYEVARAYVKDNPGCNMKTVAEETGINIKLIMKFVREKKLEFSDGSAHAILVCEKCGLPVNSGRYCNNCLSKLGKEMMQQTAVKKAAAPPPSAEDAAKKGMHYSKLGKQ